MKDKTIMRIFRGDFDGRIIERICKVNRNKYLCDIYYREELFDCWVRDTLENAEVSIKAFLQRFK